MFTIVMSGWNIIDKVYKHEWCFLTCICLTGKFLLGKFYFPSKQNIKKYIYLFCHC